MAMDSYILSLKNKCINFIVVPFEILTMLLILNNWALVNTQEEVAQSWHGLTKMINHKRSKTQTFKSCSHLCSLVYRMSQNHTG